MSQVPAQFVEGCHQCTLVCSAIMTFFYHQLVFKRSVRLLKKRGYRLMDICNIRGGMRSRPLRALLTHLLKKSTS